MGKTKLTNEQMEQIKLLYHPTTKGGRSGQQEGSMSWLSDKFNVNLAVIHRIIHGIRKPNKTVEERFMQYVQKSDTGCWLWIAGKDKDGYGYFEWRQEKVKHAHHASWRLFKGSLPAVRYFLHSCDNPSCVNPEHLSIGTNRQNINDMITRNRSLAGTKNHNSKLSEDDVLDIRNNCIPAKSGGMRAGGFKENSIGFFAQKYKVTKPVIRKILRGLSYKEL